MSGSSAYHLDTLTWCVQVKAKIPRVKNIFYVCRDWRVYAILTVLSILVHFITYVLQQFEDVYPKWDWFRLMVCGIANVCGLSYTYKPKILANRIYYACMLISALIYAITIVAYGQHFVSIQLYEDQISSVREIINKDYTWFGDSFALAHLYKQSEVTESFRFAYLSSPNLHFASYQQIYPQELLKKFKVCENLDVFLSQHDSNPYLAVAVSLENAQNNRLIPTSKMYCFENSEIIMKYATQFLVRKDFPHLEELNTFIQAINANGLIIKWMADTRIRPKHQYQSQEFKPVTIDSFKLVFEMWVCLFIGLLLVLIVENIIFHLAHKQNPTKFSQLLEMLIDSERHFLLNDIRFKNTSN